MLLKHRNLICENGDCAGSALYDFIFGRAVVGFDFSECDSDLSGLEPGDSVTVTGDVKATAVWKEASTIPGGDDDDEPGDNPGGDEPSGDDTTDSKDNGLFEILVLLGIVVVVIVLAAYAFHVRGRGGRR